MRGPCIRLDCQNPVDTKKIGFGLCDQCREIIIKQLVLGKERPAEVRRRLTEELGIAVDQQALAKLINWLAEKMPPAERFEFLRVVAEREIMLLVANEEEVSNIFPPTWFKR